MLSLLFERKIMIYEAQSRETISDSVKIGCVIVGVAQNNMKEHSFDERHEVRELDAFCPRD